MNRELQTKKIGLYFLLIINSSLLFSQTTLIYEGQTYTNSATDNWTGVVVPRNQPTNFTFRNNSVTSVNSGGYMLQAGDEGVAGSNNNLDGEVITGNRFTWNGTDPASIAHGVFTGYNINAILKYNYLSNVPMGLLRKSSGMANTSGGVAYNIVINPKSGVVAKGMKNVKVYNNTFYSAKTPADAGRGIIDIYTNTDDGLNGTSTDTKVFNNIFYTKYKVSNIKIYDNASVSGFESDYNVYWCESGEPVFEIVGVLKTFTEWQAMGYDKHSLVINPNFKDLTNFVPAVRLDYGTNLGSEWETGLAEDATWGTTSPKTTVQNGTWQVGARIYSTQMVPVSGISVTGASGSSAINSDNGYLQLSASVQPSNATGKSVTWSVTNGTGQAIISSSGLLYALGYGTVTATATANDGSGVSGSLVVTISYQVVPVASVNVSGTDGINLNASSINTDNGTLQLNAAVLPSNSTLKTVTWSFVNDLGLATINTSGLLTAVNNGTVTVKATANDGSGVSGTIVITITNQIVPVSSISISGTGGSTSITTDKGSLQLSCVIFPESATNRAIAWSIVNNTGQATINNSGLVTAVENGTVTVHALASDGSGTSSSLLLTISGQTVHVSEVIVKTVNGITSISEHNKTLQLTASVLPSDATVKTVTWSIVGGYGLASLDANGLLTAFDNGIVTIRAAANDNSGAFGSIAIPISNQESDALNVTVTHDEIKVSLSDSYNKWGASLYSFHGNVLIDKLVNGNILTFDVSKQPTGIYLVVLHKGDQIRVAKIVKP